LFPPSHLPLFLFPSLLFNFVYSSSPPAAPYGRCFNGLSGSPFSGFLSFLSHVPPCLTVYPLVSIFARRRVSLTLCSGQALFMRHRSPPLSSLPPLFFFLRSLPVPLGLCTSPAVHRKFSRRPPLFTLEGYTPQCFSDHPLTVSPIPPFSLSPFPDSGALLRVKKCIQAPFWIYRTPVIEGLHSLPDHPPRRTLLSVGIPFH